MYSAIIIGGGLYGLYAALYCAKKSNRNFSKIIILERDSATFKRATYINQVIGTKFLSEQVTRILENTRIQR